MISASNAQLSEVTGHYTVPGNAVLCCAVLCCAVLCCSHPKSTAAGIYGPGRSALEAVQQQVGLPFTAKPGICNCCSLWQANPCSGPGMHSLQRCTRIVIWTQSRLLKQHKSVALTQPCSNPSLAFIITVLQSASQIEVVTCSVKTLIWTVIHLT